MQEGSLQARYVGRILSLTQRGFETSTRAGKRRCRTHMRAIKTTVGLFSAILLACENHRKKQPLCVCKLHRRALYRETGDYCRKAAHEDNHRKVSCVPMRLRLLTAVARASECHPPRAYAHTDRTKRGEKATAIFSRQKLIADERRLVSCARRIAQP